MAAKKQASEGVIGAAARAAANLDALGVSFALVGGLAVAARSEPRFTRDVDLAVAVSSDDDSERIVHQLSARGYRVLTVIEHAGGRLATTRLQHTGQPNVFIDLLFSSSGIEKEVAAAAEELTYGGGARIRVARVGHLIALKVLSESDVRLQDRIDLQQLARVATAEEWKRAEAAVRLIRERGFHRGRALVTRLRRFRTTSGVGH